MPLKSVRGRRIQIIVETRRLRGTQACGVEVGWTLHPDHWGRGFATEAGAEAIRYAFEDLDLDRIYSCILPGNEASQAVARRLGLELLEERTMAFFPSAPHGIWSRAR